MRYERSGADPLPPQIVDFLHGVYSFLDRFESQDKHQDVAAGGAELASKISTAAHARNVSLATVVGALDQMKQHWAANGRTDEDDEPVHQARRAFLDPFLNEVISRLQ